jgi:hypothetical protein
LQVFRYDQWSVSSLLAKMGDTSFNGNTIQLTVRRGSPDPADGSTEGLPQFA